MLVDAEKTVDNYYELSGDLKIFKDGIYPNDKDFNLKLFSYLQNNSLTNIKTVGTYISSQYGNLTKCISEYQDQDTYLSRIIKPMIKYK